MPYPYRELLHQSVHNKKILIFGLGKQGGGLQVANLLAKHGAKVRITDLKSAEELEIVSETIADSIEQKLGSHAPEDILWADIIIKNPAVSFSHPLMQLAATEGIPVTTETAFALQWIRHKTIGITGTRGKTTTTYLIHHLLKTGGYEVSIGGNIPQLPTLSLLENATEKTLFVLEISSFHLEAMNREQISPHIAVLTNIYPDHLNRYETLQEYADTKASIFRWQQAGDHAFWNGAEEWNETVTIMIPNATAFHPLQLNTRLHLSEFTTSLPGEHNQQNIRVAAEVAAQVGVSLEDIQEGIKTFTGLPHRLQTVATINGIRCINDSASTTPIALQKALESCQNESYVLIAGGATKHLPFPPQLLELLYAHMDSIIWLTGSGTDDILEALFDGKVPESVIRVTTLETAVEAAFSLAQDQHASVLLFSPGFTSFEMFDNEFHRGDTFISLIKKRLSSSSK